MTDDEKPLYPRDAALLQVPKTKQCIARELRLMARGEGGYRRLTHTSPWTKNVWRAAAELLEGEL